MSCYVGINCVYCMSKCETYGVVWIRHRVEGSNSQWVLIQHIEVSVILRRKKKQNKHSIVVSGCTR